MIRNIIVLVLIIITFIACENDLKKIKGTINLDDKPVQLLKNAELIYSDSGNIQLIVKASLISRYLGENPYNEFPKGIKATFYDQNTGNIKSYLTSNYAIHHERLKTMEAKNNVVFINKENNEKLNTEHLVWDEQKAIIYSDKFVKITTKNEVLFGEGFESDESFNKWKIRKPTGSFPIKVEKTE